MKIDKLVSVIMPAYNHEKFVKQAIESVWNQTYTNIELIVIDDGSKDSTVSIIKDLQEKCPSHIKMKCVFQDNVGLPVTLNKGRRLCNGEWICVLFSDDAYEKTYIQHMAKEMQKHDNQFVVLHCDAIIIDEENNIIGRSGKNTKLPPLASDPFRALVDGKCFIVPGSPFYSRYLINEVGEYDEYFRAAEDFDMFLRLARVASFYYLDEPLYIVRKVSGSLGSRRRVWAGNILAALDKHIDYLGEYYSEAYLNHCIGQCKCFYAEADFKYALHFFIKASKSTRNLTHFFAILIKIIGYFITAGPRMMLKKILPSSFVRYARYKFMTNLNRLINSK